MSSEPITFPAALSNSTNAHATKRFRAFSPNTGAKHSKTYTVPTKDIIGDFDKENVDPQLAKSASTVMSTTVAAAPASAYEDLRGLLIEVEGNIGSGKSTLTKRMSDLANRDNEKCAIDANSVISTVFSEKVNHEFLSAFYTSTKKYAFAFQMYMLTTRIYQMDEAHRLAKEGRVFKGENGDEKVEKQLVFLDRGAVGDTLFALQNYNIGNIDAREMKVYKSVCQERFPETLGDKVDMVVYLDVDPEECWMRMTTLRQRESEEGIPLSYLDGIDKTYFHLMVNWLGERKGDFYDMNIGNAPPCLIVKWNKFGTTENILENVRQLRNGVRKSPCVVFETQKPSMDAMEMQDEVSFGKMTIVDSMEEVEEVYTKMRANDGDEFADSLSFLAVNWDLEHNTKFRRVVMNSLSLPKAKIIFYGDVRVHDGSKDVIAPSTSSISSKA